MSSAVLDASALLALLQREPGAERVAEALLGGALISAVNLSEVVSKLTDVGLGEEEIREAIEPLGLEVIAFDQAAALATGVLRRETRTAGLSLGDRACLALGKARGASVLTADAAWSTVELGFEVVLLR